MAGRLRLFDCRTSRLPDTVGLCEIDTPRIAQYVNGAQRRLVYAKEAGDEGWWGTWAEIAFNASRSTPYITLPREIARIEALTVCDRPVPVRNQFYEYLDFGNGRLPKQFLECHPGCQVQALARNNAITFTDLTNPPQILAAYITDPADVGRRILIQGWDQTNSEVYSLDAATRVSGVYLSLDSPFVATAFPFNRITGIQKDPTQGPVNIFQVDPNTGAQVLLLTMQATEQTAGYRRYYLDSLPRSCCPPISSVSPATTVQVTAIAKLELLPVTGDTDYLLIQNLEAIIEECRSIRYSTVDNAGANIQMSSSAHTQAIRLLNGELAHYQGIDDVSVEWKPFGSASLSRQKVGMM